uniref:Uncharacterized protein n=1 Tax=Tetranychus urticae TaxID=32264 RepID=T1KJH5_TETUR
MLTKKLNPESGSSDYELDELEPRDKMFPIIPRMGSVFMQVTSLLFSFFFFALIVILLHQYHMDNDHRLPALYNSTAKPDLLTTILPLPTTTLVDGVSLNQSIN